MSTATVRFGLIGFGAWGKWHAGAIAQTEGAQLCAIAAKSPDTVATARAAYPDAAVYDDYREMLAKADIDAVSVVLPSNIHFAVAKAVLESGRHLLLEKPMTLNARDCQALIDLARAQGVQLAVGHEFRLSSLWGRAKELVDEGLVGDPQYVLVELSRNPYRLGADGWRYDIARVGNWILEEPIHFFDLARWYLTKVGEPVSVYALANSRQPGHPELQDNFSAMLSFENGAYAVVSQTLSAFEHHQTVKITGTHGALWASWSGTMDRTREPAFFLKAFDGETLREEPITRMAGELFELETQMALMVAAIRDGKSLVTTGEDGMWSVAMCEAAAKSVEAGRPVKMTEVMGP